MRLLLVGIMAFVAGCGDVEPAGKRGPTEEEKAAYAKAVQAYEAEKAELKNLQDKLKEISAPFDRDMSTAQSLISMLREDQERMKQQGMENLSRSTKGRLKEQQEKYKELKSQQEAATVEVRQEIEQQKNRVDDAAKARDKIQIFR